MVVGEIKNEFSKPLMVNPRLAMSCELVGINPYEGFGFPKVFHEFYVSPQIWICRNIRKKTYGSTCSHKLGYNIQPSRLCTVHMIFHCLIKNPGQLLVSNLLETRLTSPQIASADK